MQTIKTIIACGYVMKQPTRREESVGVRGRFRQAALLLSTDIMHVSANVFPKEVVISVGLHILQLL